MNALPFACPDWWGKLQAGKMPIADLGLNMTRAQAAVNVFNRLRLPDVVGQPMMKDVAADWFREMVAVVFGTVNDENERWCQEFFELVPKKNSKTTKGAGIMLTALLVNERPRAEFLLVGPTQDVASTAFDQAEGMIEADPYLVKLFHIRKHDLTIEHRITKARLIIKTFDKKVMTGVKPVGVLVDELHVLGKNRHAAKVIEQIRGGIEVNKEGFLIFITTQSDEPPAGVFESELEYARDIRDGKVDGDMLPILYELPLEIQKSEDELWKDPKYFSYVHPNMGKTRDPDKLLAALQKADRKGVEELSIWASQHMNIQLGMAQHKNRWKGAKYWIDAAVEEPLSLERMLNECEVIVAGVDGGGLDDMLGLALAGRDRKTNDWLFKYYAWIHPDAMDRRKEIQTKYEAFVKEGSLVVCKDPTQDIEELTDIIKTVNDTGLLPEEHAIGLDPVGVASLLSKLKEKDITDKQMVAVPQGYKLSGIIKGKERRLKDGRLRHDGSQLMVWCVGNAVTSVHGSATVITKQHSGTAKIDPLIGGLNAFSLLSREPVAAGEHASPWEKEEFRISA